MKKLVLAGLMAVVPLIFATVSYSGSQEKGEKKFNELKCGVCHKAEEKGVGPSLKEIAKAYSGDVKKMVKFFKGEEKPIVEPSRFGIMKSSLNRLKKLSDSELEDIASYILSYGKGEK